MARKARVDLLLDCAEPMRLLDFWRDALGYRVHFATDAAVILVPVEGISPPLVLQQVPEPKVGKNCMHIDITTDAVEPELERLEKDTGLIVPIGAWVLGEACRQAKEWYDDLGVEDLEIAVNLSARQIVQADFVETVAAILDAADVRPERIQLCLEITETVLMGDPDTSAGVLKELQSLGFRLAIDDFGTGYSSLAYLRTFPVDLVKLDRTFITGVDRERSDRTIVGAVIDLAHALELTVVAEGVETESQLAVLRELGCDLAQGYLFARPGPPASIAGLLTQTV